MNREEPARGSLPERLLPVACIAAAGVLLASEFMTTFELTQGSLASGSPLCDLQAASRHHFALGVLAIFAILAVIAAVVWSSKPAALGVAVAGVLALLIFLIADLPKANNVGTLGGCSPATNGSFFDAKAVPQAGFWLEMVGALALALSGAALATLSTEQLRAIRPRWLSRSARGDSRPPREASATPPANATPVRGAEQTSISEQDTRRAAERRARARRRG